MMKPSACRIHSTDFMIKPCAIRLYQIGCNYRLGCNYQLLKIISTLIIGILAKSHISATLELTHC